MLASIRSSRPELFGGCARIAIALRSPGGKSRRPVVEFIEMRLFVRAGWLIATICAIMPPIDDAAIWARSTPSASRRPTASFAMSSSR